MALGGLGGLGGFINSDQGGNVLQALGMSLMSSPSNHMFKNMPTILTSLQDQSRLEQKDRRALELEGQEREALKTALIAGGLDEGEAEALSINPAAAKIRLEQVSKDRAAQQEQDFLRTFNAGSGDLSSAPRVDDTGDSWAPHRQEFGWAEPGQGDPDTPVQVAHAQVEPYTNPPRDGRQSRLGASQPIANPVQGYEAPVQVAQAGPQPVTDAYTPPQFQITNPEAQRLMKNREQLVRYHMQAPSDRSRKIIENNISHIDKQLEQLSPTSSQKEYNFDQQQRIAQGLPVQTFSDWDATQAERRRPTTTVNNNMGGGKFDEAFALSDGKALSEVSQTGMAAQRNLGRIGRLETILTNTPQGAQGNFIQIAADFGIKLDGADNVEAARAIINSLVPEQRPAGSGPMSDADLELFKQSMPRIINSSNGNQFIINTMRGIAQYDAEGAQIVQRLRAGEINRAQAFELLQSRANPLEGLDDILNPAQDQSGASGKSGRAGTTSTNVPFRIIEE
jgi:hypothetical protein